MIQSKLDPAKNRMYTIGCLTICRNLHSFRLSIYITHDMEQTTKKRRGSFLKQSQKFPIGIRQKTENHVKTLSLHDICCSRMYILVSCLVLIKEHQKMKKIRWSLVLLLVWAVIEVVHWYLIFYLWWLNFSLNWMLLVMLSTVGRITYFQL